MGLLGCGNIGSILAEQQFGVQIVAVFDKDRVRADALAGRLGARSCHTFAEFIDDDYELVVEAASIEAVHSLAAEVIDAGKDIVILSVGALADKPLHQQLVDLARERGKTIHIPSGALFGLDNMKIGQVSQVDKALLRTTKPPASLGIEAEQRQCLFRGTPESCIERFPKNINVAVALSLAVGKQVDVEIWADPAASRNTHEIFLAGEFGSADIHIQNLPCPDNPRTSYLAALSVIALLKNIDSPLKIGC
jgi:aspartate dehydrogenase